MKTRFFVLLTALCFLSLSVLAESAGDIQKRMAQRLPQIDALKSREIVGENNRGLLEERKSGSATAGSIISAENSDRQAVYAIIAKQTGADAGSVGRARARQIAANSKAGVWVQDESGKWMKK